MSATQSHNIKIGTTVEIILKADQKTGKLTKSKEHSRGIKVQLTDGQIGRVKNIL